MDRGPTDPPVRNHPEQLLNPLFTNRVAISLFTLHIVVVSLDLFVLGPWAVAHKSTLGNWGPHRAASWTGPIAAFFNRNPQSFGRLIGTWVVVRNFFEYGLHIVVAAIAVRWNLYYLLLWWIVAYRYLDVGPRRALQKLYGTPELKAARPWAPVLNWAVIATLYVLTYVVVANELLVFAKVPGADVPVHDAAPWEYAVVITANLALLLVVWTLAARYARSLLRARSSPRLPRKLPEAGLDRLDDARPQPGHGHDLVDGADPHRTVDVVHAVELRGDLADLLGAYDVAELGELEHELTAPVPRASASSSSTSRTRGSAPSALVDLAGEDDGRRRGTADHRGVGALEGEHRHVRVQRLGEHHEGTAVVARDHAEDDRALEVDDGATDLGAVLELQVAHRLR